MVRFENVCVSYGAHVVYDRFCAEFPVGVNVILGKSGSGKSTLLRVAAGLLPYEGRCECEPPAMVFQSPRLLPVSAEENVRLVTDNGVEDALKLARIWEKRRANAVTLSGGEQQRVSLARAFAANRPVWLLDEPFSGLDYGVKKELYRTLDEMLSGRRLTVLLVTHDAEEAVALGDRIYCLGGVPGTLRKVAELTQPRRERDGFAAASLELQKQLRLAVAEPFADGRAL